MADAIWNLINAVPPGILFALLLASLFTLLVCGSIIGRSR